MNKSTKINQSKQMAIGFVLLFPGILLATMVETNWALQAIGLVLIIASAAVFGSVISSNRSRKNK